jgi:hypothetical protein
MVTGGIEGSLEETEEPFDEEILVVVLAAAVPATSRSREIFSCCAAP